MLTRLKKVYSIGKGLNFVYPKATTQPSYPPYGTVLATVTNQDSILYYHYEAYPSTIFQFVWGLHNLDVIADGSGGSFDVITSEWETSTFNDVIRDDPDYSNMTRIIYKGWGSWSQCPKSGQTVSSNGGISANIYISEGDVYLQAGTYDWAELTDGVCGTYYSNTYYWYPYGTYIGGIPYNNVYSDGAGSYYLESTVPSYPSYGTPTGNTSSGTNYITIEGFDYENGSYFSTEYNDGVGGTYWDTSYNYAPYDTIFWDNANGQYRSNGAGSYFYTSNY